MMPLSMLEYQILEFQPKYQQQVIELIDSILKELGVIPLSNQLIDDPDLYQIAKIYQGQSRFWVALKNEQVIGTVGVRKINHTKAKLVRMFVAKEYRGKGVAQKLLKRAISFARKQGYKKLILDTHILMTRAHRFYQKSGFKKTGQRKDKLYFQLELETKADK